MSWRWQLALAVLGALLVAALVWLWHDKMVMRWEATPRVSEAAAQNRMLGAVLLLRQAGHPVQVAGSLGALDLQSLPDGMLIIGDQIGVTAPANARQLLAWIRRGNTLVTQPRWATPAERARRGGAALEPEQSTEAEEIEEEIEEEGEEEVEEIEEKEPGKDNKQNNGAGKPVKAPPPEALVETDPIAARYGLLRLPLAGTRRPCTKEHEQATAGTSHRHTHCIPISQYKAPLYRLDVPGLSYPLTLDEGNGVLANVTGAAGAGAAPAPLWHDEKAEVMRVYGEGKGWVVMMAGNYFTNLDLINYDHGELLLQLAALGGPARPVTIVKSLSVLPWYTALWRNYQYPLSALAVFIALLFWSAVRRFGPVLAQPALERRQLMEHIAASGAWLWKTGDGRELLLGAARAETLALVRRRAPALLRLAPQQLAATLAREAGLDPEHLADALTGDAARQRLGQRLGQIPRFTRQIRLLQKLRNHYER